MRFRAANSTILLVTGIAAFVQGAGSIGESPAHALVAVAGIALAVVAGWLQLPVRTGDADPGPGPAGAGLPAAGGTVTAAAEPTLSGQIAVTAFLVAFCYLLVFLAGVVTVDYSAYLYESGVRPETRQGVVSPGSPSSPSLRWALTPGARADTTFRRADGGSRDEMLLLGSFFAISCGTIDWTLSTEGDRQLSRGTVKIRTSQRVRIPLPDRDRATTLRLTLQRTDTQDCTAVLSTPPFWAVGRPRIPLPGLATYVESSTR